MAIGDMLDDLLLRFFGEDMYTARRLLHRARWLHEEKSPGHVWADYMFLSACHGAAAGNRRFVYNVSRELLKDFPNYDPNKRLNLDFVDSQRSVGDANCLPIRGNLSVFILKHPRFSFNYSLSCYFGNLDALDRQVFNEEE